MIAAKAGKAIIAFAGQTQAAIFRAMIVYIRTKGISVREVWENAHLSEDPLTPLLKDVCAYDTIRRHADVENWAKQRDEFWREVHSDVLAAAKSAVVQEQIKELENLQGIRSLSIANITGLYENDPLTGERKQVLSPVKPKTLEGMVNAVIRLDGHINKRRDNVMEHTAKGIPANEKPEKLREVPMIEDNLSDEEIAHVTRGILLKRAGMAPAKRNDESEPPKEEGGEE